MKFIVRFRVGNRLGAGTTYSLRDICAGLVERYSLKEKEICEIVALTQGQKFTNEDLEITRTWNSRAERPPGNIGPAV